MGKVFLAAWLVVLVGCARPMKVFLVGDFNSSTASLHMEGREGILWAITDLSSRKKVHFRVVNVHTMSDAMLRKEIESYRPDVILGPFDSATALRVIPIANEMKIPLIAPTVSSSLFTGKKDYMVRLVPENLQEVRSILYAMAKRDVRRPLLIFSEANEPYARAWIENFTNFFHGKGQGGRVVSYHSSKKEYLDLLIGEVVRWQPDAILLVSPGDEGGLIVQRVRSRYPAMKVFVSGWTMDSFFLRWSGGLGEGALAVQHFVVSHTNQVYQALYKSFVEQYRKEPSFGFIYGYDAMMLAMELYTRSKGHLRREWLRLFPYTFQGLQSVVFLDQFGDVTRKMFFIQVVSNSWQVVDEI